MIIVDEEHNVIMEMLTDQAGVASHCDGRQLSLKERVLILINAAASWKCDSCEGRIMQQCGRYACLGCGDHGVLSREDMDAIYSFSTPPGSHLEVRRTRQ